MSQYKWRQMGAVTT